MLRPIDNFFLQQQEPIKSCLEFLREYILKQDSKITEVWKYGMPFYCYNGRMFCYLWVHKKHRQPYLGIVEGKSVHHPDLVLEKRAKMKILLIDPQKDVPMVTVNEVLRKALVLVSV